MMIVKRCFLVVLFSLCHAIMPCNHQDYEQQVVSNPDDYKALYNAGVTAFKEKKLERAKECFGFLKSHDFSEHAIQGEQVFYNAGNTEMKLERYEEALASFEKVLDFNPHNEIARKKIEYIQTLLEKKKQEKQSKKDSQDQEKQDQNGQEKQQQEQQQQDTEKKDKEGKEEGTQENKDEQTSEEQQEAQHNQQKSEEKKNAQQPYDHDEEKDLTEQEKQLLAYVDHHDEKMHEYMDKKKLQKAQGVINVRNNW